MVHTPASIFLSVPRDCAQHLFSSCSPFFPKTGSPGFYLQALGWGPPLLTLTSKPRSTLTDITPVVAQGHLLVCGFSPVPSDPGLISASVVFTRILEVGTATVKNWQYSLKLNKHLPLIQQFYAKENITQN